MSFTLAMTQPTTVKIQGGYTIIIPPEEDKELTEEEKTIEIQELFYLRKRVTDLEKAVETLWYAPAGGGPGYEEAKDLFQKAQTSTIIPTPL